MRYEIGNTFEYNLDIFEIIDILEDSYLLKNTTGEGILVSGKQLDHLISSNRMLELMYDKGGSRYAYD